MYQRFMSPYFFLMLYDKEQQFHSLPVILIYLIFVTMMGEERLNALHQDIFLVYDKIIDIYTSKYPRRMLLVNPLTEN